MSLLNTNRNRDLKLFITWTAIVFLLVVIYLFSNQSAYVSNGISSKITNFLKQLTRLNEYFNLELLFKYNVNHILRKLSHFTEYFLLGFLVLLGFNLLRMSVTKSIVYTVLFCVIVACFDEVHQAFVPGRGPGLYDVFIDTLGSITGIIISLIGILPENKV